MKERLSISGVVHGDDGGKGREVPSVTDPVRCANETWAKLIEHPSQLRHGP